MGEGEAFPALSVEPQQMANWTATMGPSGAIFMLHMLHPVAMTSWRLEFLTESDSHHYDYTGLVMENIQTNSRINTVLKL